MNFVMLLRNVEKEKSSNRWKVEMRRPWNLKRHTAHCSKRWTSRPKNSRRYKGTRPGRGVLRLGGGERVGKNSVVWRAALLTGLSPRFQLFSKLQAVKAEIHDLQEEHIKERQELEQTQNELTRELKLK